jgi:CheY-like chemotaxis protein
MTLIIMHSGQSGVERGADRAARTVGLPIEGFCGFEQRDEIGPLPPEIRSDLIPCSQKGTRSAARATLERAAALIIAVPDRVEVNTYTGIEALRRTARTIGVPHWIADPNTDLDEIVTSLRGYQHGSSLLRVMITGPRLTRWGHGERFGYRLVGHLALAPVVVKRKILVVDDHVDTAKISCTLLRALGYECRSATTGQEGLEIALAFGPDIALLDIGLPDITGYELARRLRSTQHRPMFLAAITGWDQAKDAQASFAAGFDRHVRKPVGVEIIRGLIADGELHLASSS